MVTRSKVDSGNSVFRYVRSSRTKTSDEQQMKTRFRQKQNKKNKLQTTNQHMRQLEGHTRL